jgi:long-subunit acyl-CoA synthetase (AMP-forming)
MKEYYKNPEATREAMRGGWFHGGDLVRMDKEGYIYS